MKKTAIIAFLLFYSSFCFSQTDTEKWIRAFPVTNYMVDLTDSVKLVQIYLPEGPVLKEKQSGTLRGVFDKDKSDTAVIGTGRCNLIKGMFYYFTVSHNKKGRLPKENDLLYTLVDKPKVHIERIVKVAVNYIGFKTVHDRPLFDRYGVFQKWTAANEKSCIDSMSADIRFVGDYFLKNNPSMNISIIGGKYNGEMVLNIMTKCKNEDVEDFLNYVIARPQLYAGREWKISETFATWLSLGSPVVK